MVKLYLYCIIYLTCRISYPAQRVLTFIVPYIAFTTIPLADSSNKIKIFIVYRPCFPDTQRKRLVTATVNGYIHLGANSSMRPDETQLPRSRMTKYMTAKFPLFEREEAWHQRPGTVQASESNFSFESRETRTSTFGLNCRPTLDFLLAFDKYKHAQKMARRVSATQAPLKGCLSHLHLTHSSPLPGTPRNYTGPTTGRCVVTTAPLLLLIEYQLQYIIRELWKLETHGLELGLCVVTQAETACRPESSDGLADCCIFWTGLFVNVARIRELSLCRRGCAMDLGMC